MWALCALVGARTLPCTGLQALLGRRQMLEYTLHEVLEEEPGTLANADPEPSKPQRASAGAEHCHHHF